MLIARRLNCDSNVNLFFPHPLLIVLAFGLNLEMVHINRITRIVAFQRYMACVPVYKKLFGA